MNAFCNNARRLAHSIAIAAVLGTALTAAPTAAVARQDTVGKLAQEGYRPCMFRWCRG